MRWYRLLVARNRGPWREYGKYGAVGLELLLSIGIGYYAGHWLDQRYFHDKGWVTLVGFAIGVYTGFKAIWRTAKKMQRDVEIAEKLDRGEDPWDDDEDGTKGKGKGDGEAKE